MENDTLVVKHIKVNYYSSHAVIFDSIYSGLFKSEHFLFAGC